MLLTIVILSHNRKDDLLANISAMVEGVKDNEFFLPGAVEVLVVDNASTDGTAESLEVLEESIAFLKVYKNATNLGVAEGRNTAYRHCLGKYVLSIDDDSCLALDDAVSMIRTMESDPSIGVCSPIIRHAETGLNQFYHGTEMTEVANFHGACRMYRGDVLRALGGLDPACSFGGEEIDFSIRCRVAGFRVVYLPAMVCLHNSILRSGPEGGSRRQRRVYNFARINTKYFSVRTGLLHSARYFCVQAVYGMRDLGALFLLSLPKFLLYGCYHGWKQKERVPLAVEIFFRNPSLKPDFGNVPLTSKFLRKFRKR